jgi:hypothetical protein
MSRLAGKKAPSRLARRAHEIWIELFVRYGAGAEHFAPITVTKWWNAALWCLIVLGVIGWAVFLFWPY